MDDIAKQKNRARVKAWKKANPEKVKANRHKHWGDDDRLKAKLRMRSIRANKPEECNRKASAYQRTKYKIDVAFRLKKILRSRLRSAIIGDTPKSIGTMGLLGCQIDMLKQHIESLWLPGMSWNNYGLHGWHIDHKIPCASFDLSDPEQQKACFHWSNLQPLWADANWAKAGKTTDINPHDPS